jgi:CRP-like cAMP-binding protein
MMKKQSTDLGRLRAVAPFDRYPEDALQVLAPQTDQLHVRAGTVLAREGASAREFIVVLSGQVTAMRSEVAVDRAGAGTQIGGSALVQDEAHDATWMADSDLDVLVVNGPAYRWAAHAV